MLTNAGTDVVIAYSHQSKCLAGIFREFVEFYAFGDIVASHKLVGHGEIHRDEFVHPVFYLCYLLWSGAFGKVKVYLRLLALDVGVLGAFASKHSAHGLVEKMFGCVGRTMLILVVGVQYWWLFHELEELFGYVVY